MFSHVRHCISLRKPLKVKFVEVHTEVKKKSLDQKGLTEEMVFTIEPILLILHAQMVFTIEPSLILRLRSKLLSSSWQGLNLEKSNIKPSTLKKAIDILTI